MEGYELKRDIQTCLQRYLNRIHFVHAILLFKMKIFHNCNLLQIEHNTMNDYGNHLLAKQLTSFNSQNIFLFCGTVTCFSQSVTPACSSSRDGFTTYPADGRTPSCLWTSSRTAYHWITLQHTHPSHRHRPNTEQESFAFYSWLLCSLNHWCSQARTQWVG